MYNTYETTIINKHVGNGENGEFEGLSANPLAGFTCQISWSLSERSQQSLHLGPQDTTGYHRWDPGSWQHFLFSLRQDFFHHRVAFSAERGGQGLFCLSAYDDSSDGR